MSQSHALHPTNLGSRIHFLVAAAVAVVFAIGLTSTAAMAGLTPVSARDTASADLQAQLATEMYVTVRGAPGAGQDGGATTVADLAARPYLEAEPEFAPKFQHVSARSRPGRQNVLGQLGCALSTSRACRL